jgi:hypothetical protein
VSVMSVSGQSGTATVTITVTDGAHRSAAAAGSVTVTQPPPQTTGSSGGGGGSLDVGMLLLLSGLWVLRTARPRARARVTRG